MTEIHDTSYQVLAERLRYLELYKATHREIIGIIKKHQSQLEYSPADLLKDLVTYIQKKLGLFMVDILTLDEVSQELVLSVAACDDLDLDPHVKNFRIKMGQGLAGIAAQTDEVLVVNHVEGDRRYLQGPAKNTKSEMCIPIKVRHKITGILDFQHFEQDKFNSDLVQLLEDIALNISFVLESQVLYEDIRGYSEGLEKKVYEKISELRSSEERYRNMVENASDPILILDNAFQLTWCNKAAEKLLGYTQEEIRGTYFTKITKRGSIHTIFSAMKDIMDGKEWSPTEVTLLTKDNADKVVEASWSPIRENGSFSGIEMIMRDITEKQLIDRLKQDYTRTLEQSVSERTKQIEEIQRAAILAIANLAESIDPDTRGHLQRMRSYSKVIAEELRNVPKYQDLITQEYVDMIYDLSPLHDLGKVGIRDSILLKPDKLTRDEFEVMKTHSEIGADALKMAGEMMHRESIFTIAEMIARFHHERWDGKGYPPVQINGETRPLKGEEIPLCARIVALADVYDALISKRPYKEPYTHEEARRIILDGRGTHFDPDIIEAFLKREADFIRFKEQFTAV